MAKAVEIEFLMRDNLSPGLDKAGRGVDNLKLKARDLRGIIALLEAQMEELRQAGDNASPNLDQGRNIARIEALQRQIKELEAQLRRLDNATEAVSLTPPDAPQARQQFNGLHNSIQQIAREMPSLAMGPQMFFLAISNNLPVFTDELARAREEYDGLVKAGQKGVPVWKQVLSSLFSWQTALTTGIMLLSMYGNEIAGWVAGLFKAGEAASQAAAEQDALNAQMANARGEAAKQAAQLTILYKMTQNATASLRDRKAAVGELQKQYPAYFGQLSQEAILAGKAAGQYRQLASDIMQAAYARAYQQRIEKLAQDNVELERAINADTNWLSRADKSGAVDAAKARGDKAAEIGAGMAYSGAEAYASGVGAMRASRETGVVAEYDRRTEALKKNREQLEANERAMQRYEQQIMKRQPAMLKTSRGASYLPAKEAAATAEGMRRQAEQREQAERQLAEDLAALRRQNNEEEVRQMNEGTGKKLEQIRQEYASRKAEIDKQEALFRQNNKAAKAATGSDGLTDGQREALAQARDNAREQMEQDTSSLYRTEAQAMLSYLKDYGTFQEQKLAIAKEYAQKIRQVQESTDTDEQKRWRVKGLEAERDQATAAVDAKAVQAQIDWQAVFGSMTGVLRQQLESTLEQLKQYAGTGEFQGRDAQEQKMVYESIDKLTQALGGGEGTLDFPGLKRKMEALGADFSRLQALSLSLSTAYQSLQAAQRAYEEAMGGGTASQQEAARAMLSLAQATYGQTKTAYDELSAGVRQQAAGLRDTMQGTVGGLGDLAEGLSAFEGGSAAGAFAGLQKSLQGLQKLNIPGAVGEAVGKLSDTLSSAGFAGQILSAMLGLLDVLKDGIGPIVASLVDTVLGAVTGMLRDILSGGIVTKALSSLLDGLGGLLDALTFGGFSSWLDTSNASEVQATIDRLTERNEKLQTSIEDLTDEIKASKGTKSVAAYRDAYKNQKETNANYLEMAMAQAGYHGSHHSWNYYWQGFSQDEIDDFSRQIGREWDGSLWSLSPEEMKTLRDNVDMWKKIQDSGKGGYGERLTDKLDDYIEQAGKLEELTDQLYQGLTGISFDSMYSSFVDNLMDMKYDSKQAAEDISEYFMRAMLSNKIGEMYSDKLKEWWEKFGKAMEDGNLSEEERKALAEEYMGYVNGAMELRENLAEATGYDPGSSATGQSAKAGGFTAMTQDQGTKLEGMFTSGLQHWASIDSRVEEVAAKMDTAQGHLLHIEENTGASAAHLMEIKDEIRKIIRDGLKVK